MAAHALNRLGWVLAEPRYLRVAEATLRAGLESLHQTPHAHAGLALALQEFLYPSVIVVLRIIRSGMGLASATANRMRSGYRRAGVGQSAPISVRALTANRRLPCCPS